MDAHSLKMLLLARLEDVLQYLLPLGERKGNYWHVGSISGERGDSLRVCMAGGKRGVWLDGANSDDKGDILDLWCAVKGHASLREALPQVREYLGVKAQPDRPAQRAYIRPKPTDMSPIKQETHPVVSYLIKERRLTAEIIREFKVHHKIGPKPAMAFPYYNEAGELVMIKYVGLERINNRKKVWTSADPQKILFGMNTSLVMKSRGELLICEGEIDAMTWQMYGAPAVSVPFGAKKENQDGSSPNVEWIDNCHEFLNQFHTIYLSMDKDPAGDKAREDIVKRLGRERCKIIKLEPHKDSNEAHLAGFPLRSAILTAETVDPDTLVSGKLMAEKVWNIIRSGPLSKQGTPILGWEDFEFRLRPRESTVWTGYNDHGKTTFVRQLVAWLASRGEPVFVGSYEHPSSMYLAKLLKQGLGRELNPTGDAGVFSQLTDGILANTLIHEREGEASWREFLEHAKYASRRYGVMHAVLDNVSSVDLNLEDNEKAEKFTKACQSFWKETGVHLHAIFHPRKGLNEQLPPRKCDIKGSGIFTDLFCNVVVVHRLYDHYADGQIIVEKQRESSERPKADLWFDAKAERFLRSQKEEIKPFIPLCDDPDIPF